MQRNDLSCTPVSFAIGRWKQRQNERHCAGNLDGKVMGHAGICLAPSLPIGAHANGGMSATVFEGQRRRHPACPGNRPGTALFMWKVMRDE
jgi:hypothetical protein